MPFAVSPSRRAASALLLAIAGAGGTAHLAAHSHHPALSGKTTTLDPLSVEG